MVRKVLNAKATTHGLLLLIMCLFTGSTGWQTDVKAQETTQETIGSAMLLISSEPQTIEEKFNPETLIELGVLELGVTTEWQTIRELAQSGQLKSLIIHHAALEQVNNQELASWFRNDKLVLTGLGIQGDLLAETVGMLGLFTYPYQYSHTEFFYTYSYAIEGTPQDLALFNGDDGSSDFTPGGVQAHLSRSARFATDSLLEDSDAKRMLFVTKEHLAQQDEFQTEFE